MLQVSRVWQGVMNEERWRGQFLSVFLKKISDTTFGRINLERKQREKREASEDVPVVI